MITSRELEERLTTTLRTVADQTQVSPPVRPVPSTASTAHRRSDRTGRPGRRRWLAAAAVAAIALASGVSLARSDQTAIEAVGEPTVEPLPIGDDGVLHLLPPDLDQPWGTVRYNSGDLLEPSGDQLLIGRATDDGYDDLVAVYHEPDPTMLSADESTAETIADRILYEVRGEGVGARQPDGSWIVFQDEFIAADDRVRLLAGVVAGTSLVDGQLVFTPGDRGLDVVSRAAAGIERPTSTLSLFPESSETPADEPTGPDVGGLTLLTSAITDPSQILFPAGVVSPTLTETVIQGRPAFQHTLELPNEGPVTVTTWSPVDGYGATLFLWGASAQEAADYAASLLPVDGEAWAEALAQLE